MLYYTCISVDNNRRINQKGEVNFLRKLADGVAIAVVVSVASATAVSASEQQPQVYGGWSEEKTIKGRTNKRSHGWTTWKGVKHYTTARLEHYWPNKGAITSSGRKYGTGRSQAVTKWVPFNPNAKSNGYGKARTYYGR